MKFPMRANILTTVLASIITAFGTSFSSHVLPQTSRTVTVFIDIVSGIFFFLIPLLILVLGLTYIKDYILYRIKHFGLRIFIFPSNQDDVHTLTRILTYFFITV
jgi:hypothetical protein